PRAARRRADRCVSSRVRARRSLSARRAAAHVGRALDSVALPSPEGGGADHRRQRHRNAGNARGRAREAHRREVLPRAVGRPRRDYPAVPARRRRTREPMMWRRLFMGPVNWHLLALAVLPTLALAWAAAHMTRVFLTNIMRGILRDTIVTTSPLVRAPLRLIWLAAFWLVFAVLIFPAFEVMGLRPRAGVHLGTLSAWAFDSGLRILLI